MEHSNSPRANGHLETRGIFRRKPIEDDSESGLERSIGLWQLTAIGLANQGETVFQRLLGKSLGEVDALVF